MKIILKLIICIILIQSCKQEDVSGIEVIKFDNKIIDIIISEKDSSYSEHIGSDDFYNADYYITYKDSGVTVVFKDSSGNVVGLKKTQKGKTLFAREYYANGQVKGKTQFKPGTISGPATYYYQDGRIRSQGLWQDYKKIGVWKNYNENGKLSEIVRYDDNGNEVEVEKFE